MKENVGGKLSKRLRRTAIAIAASGMAATAIHANPSNSSVLVPPADLPELARQGGEAMLLHETIDGKTLLYIEQNQGARLAALDVTDPLHVKGKGSVQLDAAGPFDFMFPLGDRAELVRYRQGQGDAVLDLRKVPKLNKVGGLKLQGPTAPLGNAAYTVTDPLPEQADMQAARDYQVVYSAVSRELSHVFDVKQVRQETTNAATGTTFVLTENGLYLIRQPGVEALHQMMVIPPN
jgi:hypothetical protein